LKYFKGTESTPDDVTTPSDGEKSTMSEPKATSVRQVVRELRKESRKLVLNTTEDRKMAERLKEFFDLRGECAFDLNRTEPRAATTGVKYCPSTADFLICFPSSPANKTIEFKCPYKKGLKLKDNTGDSFLTFPLFFV
jgi:hypothetical protein